ncbi:MAG TPA: LamG-like jellyroll fold domain-containing protein [Candidatus Saccharimonadales bacterium]|nr:LamG-like jellyroll fold domain-containing protein [Candidatus Saccharimonadales bacterium]
MKTKNTANPSPFSRIPLFTAALAAAGMIGGAQAQLHTAGTLLVNVDATGLTAGPLPSVANAGTMGGFFEARGGGAAVPEVAPVNGNGTKGIRFNGASFMQHVTTVGGAFQLADPTLTGPNPTCTIEAWAFNPAIAQEETMVAWGHRGGGDGSNMSFNYGANGSFGAVGHWGAGPDIGWNDLGGSPAGGQWHHLVYTYDGTTTRVYSDGVLQNSESTPLNTWATTPISLATQLDNDAGVPTGGLRGSLTLARVRIHADAMSASDILDNYNLEKNNFSIGTPAPLVAGPVHRYSFNNAAGGAPDGSVVLDSVGTANGLVKGGGAVFTGSRLTLSGGPNATASYVDLPNGLVSVNSADNGGSGKITLEGWVKITGGRTWSRIFDIGSTDIGGGVGGELNGPGGGGAGLDYLFYSAQVGDDVNTHRFEMRNEDPAGGGAITVDTGTATFNQDLHFAVTWDEENNDLRVYENGSQVNNMRAVGRMSQLHDVNVWLGRSNWPDQEMQGDFDEFRIYTNVLTAPQVLASYQAGPNSLAVAAPVSFTTQPSDGTINEFGSIQFSIGAQGSPPINYQWFKDGVAIPGATGTVLTLTDVPYSDNGTVYYARATNSSAGTTYTAESSHATLTVNPDQAPPTIRQVRVAGPNSFEIIFSERVNPADAVNLNNYEFSSFTGSATLSSASQGSDTTRVLITAADPFICTYYTVSVSGVHDISTSANVISPGSTAGFLYAIPSGLKHRYTFNNAVANDASGATVPDVVGTANATVRNLTGITTFTGNRITLSGGNSTVAPYVDLPNGLLSVNGAANGGSGEMTFEGWVKVTGGHSWSRIFDFGSTQGGEVNSPGGGGTGLDYLFYSAQVGDDVTHRQISIRDEDPGGGGGSSVDLPTSTFNQDTHFVVTWKESTGELKVYENNVQIGTYNSPTPMSQINDVNVWLGRSNWAPDQNLQGEFDEFRLYNQVLTPEQIAVDYTAGPDNNYGAPQSVTLSAVSTNMLVNDFQASRALVSFGNVANVDLTKAGCILFESSDPNVLQIDANGVVTSVGAGSATISANFNGIIGSLTVNVVALPVTLKHRYSFCDDPSSTKAHDTAGTAHGILHGGSAFSGFGTLTMNGVDGYVDLPNGIISSLSNATFEAWVTYSDTRSWARVFDFGSNDAEDTQNAGSNYVTFTPRGPTNFRFEAKAGGAGPSPVIFGAGPLVTDLEVHIAVTYNELGKIARVYTNGVLVDSGLITVPLATISDFNNWLGRSQFNDPYFKGSFNEFRIYEGAMTPSQVAASFTGGPDASVSAPRLSIARSGANYIVSYPAGNCDFFLESTSELGPNAQWLPVLVAPSQNGDNVEYSVPAQGPTQFFRLSK